MKIDRRRFLVSTAAFAGGGAWTMVRGENAAEAALRPGDLYPISLAQWSLHRMIHGGELDNLDFPAFTQKTFGIHAVEWVNQFFHEDGAHLGYQSKGPDYLAEMKKRTDDLGVENLLIMCDRVGSLGDPDTKKRTHAVEGHYAWLEAAKYLGCHSIRVNAASDGRRSPEEQADLCADGLARLSEHAATMELNVIVENHGGLSSNGAWLASLLKKVNLPNCGSLPDYGNFYVARNRGDAAQYAKAKESFAGDPVYQEDERGLYYDRYQGVEDLMPFAKGVSAKAHDFDEAGNEIHTDFARMHRIVRESGYIGPIGIEYEGHELGEVEGITKTKQLLEKVIAEG